MHWRNILLSVLLAIFVGSSALASDLIGELGISGGGIYPQGDFARYSDPGVAFLLRANPHITGAEAISGWFALGVNFFSSDDEPVLIDAGGFILPAKKTVAEYGGSLHFGIQLGSESRHGFFRPRAGLAPGLYYFNTETSIRPLDYDEDLVEINEGQVRFGWKGALGADFFFTPKWGVSFEFTYDHVVNLHRDVEIDEFGNSRKVSRSARFQGFQIGVVIPFETMDE